MKTPSIVIIGFAFVLASLSCRNVVYFVDGQKVSSSAATIKLQFPEPWLEGTEQFSSIQQIEVRKLPNSSNEEFFFGALPYGDNFYAHEVDNKMPKPQYGQNVFAVNFSDSVTVRTATQQEWNNGSRIPTKARLVFPERGDDSSGEIEYKRKRYSKVGKYWGQGLLSPSGKWLAIFSYTGEKTQPVFFGGGTPRDGDIFWQIYDTVTGKKVFEWEAKNVERPAELDSPVVWLEDHHFLFPQDNNARNFFVVTLPAVSSEVNPVTIQFPSRRDAAGKPLPPGDRDEVWIPLVPLTKEQAAKLTAPYETEITGARLLGQPVPTELLFAIKEETENRRISRHQGDGSGDYHYKVVSTYYYALSLDNPTQTRFATKEEWDRGQNVRSDHSTTPEEPVAERVKGIAPPYRKFPKTGTSWGSLPRLSADEWIAILSYSDDGQGAPGTMFVDFYDQRLGDKLLSTTLPFTGRSDELFKHALWIEGGYVMLPLKASLDSFALWQLP